MSFDAFWREIVGSAAAALPEIPFSALN